MLPLSNTDPKKVLLKSFYPKSSTGRSLLLKIPKSLVSNPEKALAPP